MVDIHSHLLYGIDDGPEKIEESIELLKQAIEVGYNKIVCSSHYYIGMFENKDYDKNFNQLLAKIREEGLDIEIYKGNEIALLSIDYSDYAAKVNRINNGKYILIELKSEIIYSVCKKFFKSLISQGIVPIFAHIERYSHLKIGELIELSKMGVVLQVNIRTAATSVKKIDYMLKEGYIDVIATDTHRLGRRDYDLEKELKKLKSKLGEEYFNRVIDINPSRIIDSEDIVRGKIESSKDRVRIMGYIRGLYSRLIKK